MVPAKRDRLQKSYAQFVDAVKAGAENVTELGDELEEVYSESKN
jgi:hypothetical protein